MSSLPENDRPRGLEDTLRALVDGHGLEEVVAALATVCRWKAHHHNSHGRSALAARWHKAAMNLTWTARIHAKGLDPADDQAIDLHQPPRPKGA